MCQQNECAMWWSNHQRKLQWLGSLYVSVHMATQSRGCEVAPLKRAANVTVGMVNGEDGKSVPVCGWGEGG